MRSSLAKLTQTSRSSWTISTSVSSLSDNLGMRMSETEEIDMEEFRKSKAHITMDAINKVREEIRSGKFDIGKTAGYSQKEERKVQRVFDREEDKKRVEKLKNLSVRSNTRID